MWRKLPSHLQTLRLLRSSNSAASAASTTSISHPSLVAFRQSATFISRHFSIATENVVKRVEDVMPIATGHEREELEAKLQGRELLDINFPVGPFGTKEEPAVVKSYYDKRIVGCPGGGGEDEHDVVWFWIEKGKPHECPVCSQYFALEVVGPGGPPDGHGDSEDHH